ncbi:hypothetical protein PPERSA_12718 [Pseudocohnilembus persalinus]|uniref:PhoD-like phosphatase metallophosphatase domain-containing protein n=1 Tax=Pseudocohnilembus persalinus TaxID=266149 RepID=A0A0V0QTH5_PSEPJ|nr:hypothetical protein PPERSA_12718 [Pseudocohnilembus persalinus]|eukprot:KRX05540.1 hypothetical protein PPERSA_12718 [Pseudocohnilembus persalinus]
MKKNKEMRLVIFVLILFIFQNIKGHELPLYKPETIPVKDEGNIRITFGSCNKYEENQQANIFKTISKQHPDSFVWLGDIAYIDSYWIPYCFFWWVPEQDIENMYRKFNSTKNDVAYQQLLGTGTRILGIYDDHDYNNNDGGRLNPYKKVMQEMLFNFLDEPMESPRRKNDILFGSYYFGENKKVKLILLDGRSEKHENSEVNAWDNLGEIQWQMLEEQLNDPNVELFIIASGYVIIPDDKFIIENWFWPSKRKLLNILKKYKKRTIFLAGDIHYGEISDFSYCTQKQYGFPFIEVISSGLSFSEVDFPLIDYLRFIAVTDNFSKEEDRYYGNNFGQIDVQIDENDIDNSIVNIQIYGFDNEKAKVSRKVFFKELNHNEDLIEPGFVCPIQEGVIQVDQGITKNHFSKTNYGKKSNLDKVIPKII